MLPEGWENVSLGAVCQITTGGTPNRAVPEYWNGDIPWMSSGEINQRIVRNVAEHITALGMANSNARRLPAGTVMMALNGQGKTRGKVALLQIETTCNQSLAGLIADRTRLLSDYLFHSLDAQYQDIRNITGDDARNGLNLGILRALAIALPPLDEQRRIAEVLRWVDDAIAATQSTLQAAATVRQVTLDALIQRVLDDPETEVRPLSETAEVRTGLAKNKNRTGPKVQVPYLRVANVQDGWFDLSDMQEIEVGPAQVDRYLLQAGDVLLTEGGDYDKLGRGGVWHGEVTPCLHQNHVFCVRPDTNTLLPDYFALATQSAWGRAYFLTCAKRTTNLASINSSQLRAFPVPVIATAMQARLIEEVSGIDAMIDLEERQLETLLRLRAEVSSDLLSGRVRVPA